MLGGREREFRTAANSGFTDGSPRAVFERRAFDLTPNLDAPKPRLDLRG